MRCDKCDTDASFEVKASGHWLCDSHLLYRVEKRIKKTIRQWGLLSSDARIIVALSGSSGSSVCLKVLNDIIRVNPKQSLIAVTVDEGLGRDMIHAKGLCEDMGIDHHIILLSDSCGIDPKDIAKNAKDEGIHPCDLCAKLRKKAITQFAKEHNARAIACGDDMDDELSKTLLTIIKGDVTGISFPGPIKKDDDMTWIKPLIDVPSAELDLYVCIKGLSSVKWRCDNSAENRMDIVKELLDDLDGRHPGTKHQMMSSVKQMRDICAKLDD